MLISQETKDVLNRLVQSGFIANRIWDRGLSVLNVKFAMNNFEKIFHVGLAHRFPVDWSDTISEILSAYNELTDYFETPTDSSIYSTPLEFFEKNLRFHEETYVLIKRAIDIAVDNGDYNAKTELEKFMIVFNKYINQAILLKDKSIQYGNEYAKFDHDCGDFFLFGE